MTSPSAKPRSHDEKVKEALVGKQIVKVIVVKNKLVNIVIKG